MDIKLIVCDLDGTLLVNHEHVSLRNRQALEAARKRGITIAIASGRAGSIISDVLTQVDGIGYVISANGALCTQVNSGEVLSFNGMDYKLWSSLSDYLKSVGCVFEVYCNAKSYMEAEMFSRYRNERVSDSFTERLKSIIIPIESFNKDLPIAAEKISVFNVEDGNFDKVYELLAKDERISIASSLPGNIDITARGVNKGVALRELCLKLAIDSQQVMAFGDADNDVEMLEFAGYSVAMGNASKRAKISAKHSTLTCEEDGVGVEIERMLNQLG